MLACSHLDADSLIKERAAHAIWIPRMRRRTGLATDRAPETANDTSSASSQYSPTPWRGVRAGCCDLQSRSAGWLCELAAVMALALLYKELTGYRGFSTTSPAPAYVGWGEGSDSLATTRSFSKRNGRLCDPAMSLCGSTPFYHRTAADDIKRTRFIVWVVFPR